VLNLASKFNSRAVAAQLLTEVITEETHIETLLARVGHDKPFIQELCFGVLRYLPQLEFLAKKLLKKPFHDKDTDIHMLVLVGIYQLLYLDTAEFAAVNECVTAAKQLKKVWAASLVNAVLRSFLRQKETLVQSIDLSLVAKYAHPHWLIEQLKKVWPNDWQKILVANNQHPPLILRVNRQKISRDNYLEKLVAANIDAIACEFSKDGIVIVKKEKGNPHPSPLPQVVEGTGDVRRGNRITDLPGFADGEFSVQDEATQFAAELLELKPGLTVLDCCAAPGGKTCHILETEPKLAKLIAIDNNAKRVERIHENLQRLNLSAEVIVADIFCFAKATQNTQDTSKKFERILLDAPCSATGVIRRHPEIKTLRELSDIENLAAVQLKLLATLWPLLKPNGILLYATCSIFPQENEQVIEQFLRITMDCKIIPITAAWGYPAQYGRYCLPPESDGFYYAKLQKTA
jgi:16S rRNA (cytosine967-C5)-methyltransferase